MIDWTPALRLHAAYRRRVRNRRDAAAIQERTLLALVRRAADTGFGRAHGFRHIRTVADFQRQVPLRTFDEFWRDWLAPTYPVVEDVSWPGRIPYFALSSGTTTGRSKAIPVSRAMVASNNRVAVDLLGHHALARPKSRVLSGKSFMLGGSVAMEQLAPGVMAGDLSGIARAETPFWSGGLVFPSLTESADADWETRIERLARLSLDEPIRTIAGTPSWLLLFFERLAAVTGRGAGASLSDFYPGLELIVVGGTGFRPYADRFAAWLGGRDVDIREVFPASEGFVASADAGPEDGLLLNLDHGLFFEFVPLGDGDGADPTRHTLADAEVGAEYELVLSTCAGLWAHRIGDTVRLVDRNPPRLVVTGRTGWDLSAFGEHVAAHEIEAAVLAAASAIGRGVAEYAVGARYPDAADPTGQHVFVVEFVDGEGPVPDAPNTCSFAKTVDQTLLARNADYAAHRAGDLQMGPPRIVPVRPGTFVAWMRERGRLGGQNKIPRVILDADLFADLMRCAAEHRIDPSRSE